MHRRRWPLLVVLIVGLGALSNQKPQWYLDEAAVMEQVAGLLDSPVPYDRGGEGWSWAQHVSRVVLPRVDLDKDRTRQLAILLRKLPRTTLIVCYYVWDQEDSIEQLRTELAGHASVIRGPGASSQDIDTLQEQTHVAGIHRPDLLGGDRSRTMLVGPQFQVRLETGRFRWATNLPLDLRELNGLAERTWAVTQRWLRTSETAVQTERAVLPIYLCASSAELQAIEDRFGLIGSSFQVRSNVGGYYHAGPLVAVIASPRQAPEFVVHEVVHAVIETVVPNCPDPINEGAAMLLTERVLGEKAQYAGWATQHERTRRELFAKLRVEQLTLESLFSLDYQEFRDTRDSRNYWLSLALMRVLDRENSAKFPGKLRDLVRALAERGETDAFTVFAEVYPAHEIETLWKEQLRRAVRGTEPR